MMVMSGVLGYPEMAWAVATQSMSFERTIMKSCVVLVGQSSSGGKAFVFSDEHPATPQSLHKLVLSTNHAATVVLSAAAKSGARLLDNTALPLSATKLSYRKKEAGVSNFSAARQIAGNASKSAASIGFTQPGKGELELAFLIPNKIESDFKAGAASYAVTATVECD
ncbi:hypothetical protein [Vibrio nigripulchritudo]|nr:hypothetical protein [Vibrio nigripulchritudo]